MVDANKPERSARLIDRHKKNRWSTISEYSENWVWRNSKLLDLLLSAGLDSSKLSFTEYGCGPRQHFRELLLKKNPNIEVKVADLEVRCDDCIKVDLDFTNITEVLPKTDVAVLSGVVEYLRDPKKTFSRLLDIHNYLLFSYSVLAFESKGDLDYLSQLFNNRSKLGWKNHLEITDVMSCFKEFGYVIKMGTWEKQLLFLVVRWD